MPDSPHANLARRAWRFMAAAGLILGAISLFLHAVSFNDHEDTAYRSERAICAIILYAEEATQAAKDQPPPPNIGKESRERQAKSIARLTQLSRDMRATGVQCPPDKPGP